MTFVEPKLRVVRFFSALRFSNPASVTIVSFRLRTASFFSPLSLFYSSSVTDERDRSTRSICLPGVGLSIGRKSMLSHSATACSSGRNPPWVVGMPRGVAGSEFTPIIINSKAPPRYSI